MLQWQDTALQLANAIQKHGMPILSVKICHIYQEAGAEFLEEQAKVFEHDALLFIASSIEYLPSVSIDISKGRAVSILEIAHLAHVVDYEKV